jgi:23S rRNA (cytosine1962-C5)-methyltransferase
MQELSVPDRQPIRYESPPEFELLAATDWEDYELLDSGSGARLERYGPYTFIRPEAQAVWPRALPLETWRQAHGVFQPTGEESGGRWSFQKPVEPSWIMEYKGLRFQAHAVQSRHMGVFPEQAAHWDWMGDKIRSAARPVRVLNLFGYTGLASLAAAQAGAHVTHVDASKKAIGLGRHNQGLSELEDRPIRWLVDDVFKFVQREVRRGSRYEGIVLDPPKFGRGPAGQVWQFFDSLPGLLAECRTLLSDDPLFVVLTAYAIRASALSVYYALQDNLAGLGGRTTTGELGLIERSAGRMLSTALFSRWSAD